MRIPMAVLAALAISACASFDGRTLVPGKSTAKEVVGLMGAPAMELKRPNGDVWLYFPRLPGGHATFVATIDPNGVLRGIDQRLVRENIFQVRVGMRADEVRELLGPPYEAAHFARTGRDIWEYPWLPYPGEKRVLWVEFSADGVARKVVEQHDYLRQPENDRR